MNEDRCPCDTCAYKKMNYEGKHCPNFHYFFTAFMDAYDGILKTDRCDEWKEMRG